MDPSASGIPQTNFMLYLYFAQQLVVFFFPSMIGVICSIAIKELKRPEDAKKLNIAKSLLRVIVWTIPSAIIITMIDIIFGTGVSDVTKMLIFGFAFFAGMVGEEIATMFTNMRIWIKVCKEVLKDLGEAIGKADIGKTITDALEEELEQAKKASSKSSPENDTTKQEEENEKKD